MSKFSEMVEAEEQKAGTKLPPDFEIAMEGLERCTGNANRQSGGSFATKALWEIGAALWSIAGQLSQTRSEMRWLYKELNALNERLEKSA